MQQIFNCELNSDEGINWLQIANKKFNDFRNKFLDTNVEDAVEAFKEKRAQ